MVAKHGTPSTPEAASIAIIGCVGVPNRYGGFESFAEHIGRHLAHNGYTVTVTCDARVYKDDPAPQFDTIHRLFIRIPANGALSPLHDLVAFFRTAWKADRVLILGVSGGLFFPLFWLANRLFGAAPFWINVDGIEWRRAKFGPVRRAFLLLSDRLAQRFAHGIIYDNPELEPYTLRASAKTMVAYSGDHARSVELVAPSFVPPEPYLLTICRIEPENNCDVLIQGFLGSSRPAYVFIGNWNANAWGRALRERYRDERRLWLLDPVYDPAQVAWYRSHCDGYLHGHSVGGTNPSLVEILFFDCAVLCLDCSYNRATAGASAAYFSESEDLTRLLDHGQGTGDRADLRKRYSAKVVADELLSAMR
jgi:glycosyltransferase involved in cell wall biosynthesis